MKKDCSVATPSIVRSKYSNSQQRVSSFYQHPSNPNPQNKSNRFKGVREAGYQSFDHKMFDPTNVIKFGKKVNYDTRMNN